ncbi:helix-turn-helix domain-containing protein [Streptosporangium longisporum]|uniref:TetR/AcrR family transcriptional regulator n=1 Tax=Streptosporangium longisporum TaxID=46187 RepID=A0ABN3YDM9_9ACTN
MRVDARRNREHLLTTARAVIAEQGPEASLNEIARQAGVGPGTLYRHFPTRQALLAAVFQDRVETLCARADDLLTHTSPDEALDLWSRDVLAHALTDGGMSTSMTRDPAEPGFDCHAAMRSAATGLLSRAQREGRTRRDVDVEDFFQLVTGVALAASELPGGLERADHLLAVTLAGLRDRDRGGTAGWRSGADG